MSFRTIIAVVASRFLFLLFAFRALDPPMVFAIQPMAPIITFPWRLRVTLLCFYIVVVFYVFFGQDFRHRSVCE